MDNVKPVQRLSAFKEAITLLLSFAFAVSQCGELHEKEMTQSLKVYVF